ATENGGGILELPPGFCKISEAIAITAPIRIVGAGTGAGHGIGNSGGTTIRTISAGADVFTVTTDRAVTFEDFSIDSAITKTAGAGINITGAKINSANVGSKIINMRISGMWNAVRFGNGFSWKLINNWIQDYQHDGVFLEASSVFPDGAFGGQVLSGN